MARDLDLLYEGIIKPAVESVRIPESANEYVVCHRGDKEPRPGEIVEHIVENLVLSDIAIADLTGKNPNVFYELGVRHAVNDNTILIAQSEEDIPFDLRGQRFIIYSRDFAGGVALRNKIASAVEDIISAPNKIDNPVRRFLYDRQKEQIQSQGTPPGYDVTNDLLREIADLRHEVRFVLNAVTSGSTSDAVDPTAAQEIGFLEGFWRIYPSSSLLVMRLVGSDMLAPYRFADTEELGHYRNIRRIGNNVVLRWESLDNPRVCGYGLYRVDSPDMLVGGWWYAGDVPREVANDPGQFHSAMPQRHKSVIQRVAVQDVPEWAEDYFRNALRRRVSDPS